MPNMLSFAEGRLVTALPNDQAPSATEWEAFTRLLMQIPPDSVRVLVFTDGGAPNPQQRGRFVQYLRGHEAAVGVVTTSVVARAAVTALSWFNGRIRHFQPTAAGFSSAVGHLDLDRDTVERVMAQMRVQASRIEGGAPAALPSAWR